MCGSHMDRGEQKNERSARILRAGSCRSAPRPPLLVVLGCPAPGSALTRSQSSRAGSAGELQAALAAASSRFCSQHPKPSRMGDPQHARHLPAAWGWGAGCQPGDTEPRAGAPCVHKQPGDAATSPPRSWRQKSTKEPSCSAIRGTARLRKGHGGARGRPDEVGTFHILSPSLPMEKPDQI